MNRNTTNRNKNIPHEFILDELESVFPYTKPMFGFTGVYVGQKIVFALRERDNVPDDNGVWIATVGEHHESLRKLLPSMRSLAQFGPGPTDWQVIPSDSLTFEEEVLRACELVLKHDPRIGKIPKVRRPNVKKQKKSERAASKRR
jgi:hypothetical protein